MGAIMKQFLPASIMGMRKAFQGIAFCVVASMFIVSVDRCSAGQQVIVRQRALGKVAVAQPFVAMKPGSDQLQAVAALKTDPDLEAILEKANRYLADKNYTVAAQLWQAVLEKCGDTLYSQDEKTYFSMIDQVEAILSGLDAEALKIYRINADAAAKQILARSARPNDVEALSQVVRRYFVSSIGDDVAFQLAAILIDRFDFLGALRLLEKIRDRHPDPSISRQELESRIAFCHILVGDSRVAKQLIDQITEAEGDSSDTTSQLAGLLGKSADELSKQFDLTALSSFRNFRVQPSVPENFLQGNLIGAWQFHHELPTTDGVYRFGDMKGMVSQRTPEDIDSLNETVSQVERGLINNWRQNNWRPNGSVIVSDGQVFFKSVANLVSWPTKLSSEPNWRSLWLNQFELDDATKSMEQIRNSYGNQTNFDRKRDGVRFPNSANEISFFGDNISPQLTKIGNVIYSLEGRHYDPNDNPQSSASKRRGFQYNATFRRTRTNFLVAYEAVSGRVLWTLPKNSGLAFRSDPAQIPAQVPAPGNQVPADADPRGVATPAPQEEPWLANGGFMGAPLGFNKTLIVPVNVGGAIYVYGLDPNDSGRTLWKTYLCDEPETSAAPWAPITLTIDGTDLFVASGMGVIFVLDPTTGAIRFAQRYDRLGERNQYLANFGWQVNRLDFDGWSEDLVVPYSRQMICFCSDTKKIFAIDRTTAELIWEVEMNPLGFRIDYVIGIQNDVLFAGGPETIIAIDLSGEGRMLWGGDQLFEQGKSVGRAMLCADGLYVPVDDTIVRFDAGRREGKPRILNTVHVNCGNNGPCGNLFSDGERIWIQYINRLIATESVARDSGKQN